MNSIQYNNKLTNILVDWLLSVYNKRGSVDQVFCSSMQHFFPTSLTLKHLNICSVLLVINCTSLMVSPGGPLRMASCANHYGSKCNFSCATGYRLNGSSTVTCIAVGNSPPGFWDRPMPVCQGGLKLVLLIYWMSNDCYNALIFCFNLLHQL